MASKLFVQLIDDAIEQAGSLNELSRALDWPHSNILRCRREQTLSPYRAAQIAHFGGAPPVLGVMLALREGSKTSKERAFWDDHFQSDLMQYELLNLSRIVRHAEMKANTAGADAEKFKKAAKKAREAIAAAVASGAKLPPAMEGNY